LVDPRMCQGMLDVKLSIRNHAFSSRRAPHDSHTQSFLRDAQSASAKQNAQPAAGHFPPLRKARRAPKTKR
jgi:hypothetical protein